MATEHDFMLISMDGAKLKTLYDHLSGDRLPKGIHVIGLELKENGDYKSLSGTLRRTELSELMDEINKADIEIDNVDYFVVKYDYDDQLYLGLENPIVIASDWHPYVEFTPEARNIPFKIKYMISDHFGG